MRPLPPNQLYFTFAWVLLFYKIFVVNRLPRLQYQIFKLFYKKLIKKITKKKPTSKPVQIKLMCAIFKYLTHMSLVYGYKDFTFECQIAGNWKLVQGCLPAAALHQSFSATSCDRPRLTEGARDRDRGGRQRERYCQHGANERNGIYNLQAFHYAYLALASGVSLSFDYTLDIHISLQSQ